MRKWWTEVRANRAYEHYRSERMKDGRRFSRPPDPYTPPATPQSEINITDPDSHVIKGARLRHREGPALPLFPTPTGGRLNASNIRNRLLSGDARGRAAVSPPGAGHRRRARAGARRAHERGAPGSASPPRSDRRHQIGWQSVVGICRYSPRPVKGRQERSRHGSQAKTHRARANRRACLTWRPAAGRQARREDPCAPRARAADNADAGTRPVKRDDPESVIDR